MVVRDGGGKGWVGAGGGAKLEGLALAEVPRRRHAGLGEHVRLIYVTPGPVADPGLDSTCPPSNQPLQPPPPSLCSSWTKCPPNAGGSGAIGGEGGGGGVKGWEVKSAAPGH